MKKNLLIFKITALIMPILFLSVCCIAVYYHFQNKESQRADKIRKSFTGSYADKKNHVYDKDFKISVLKPGITVTSARTVNGEQAYNVTYTTDDNSLRYTKGNINGNTYIFLGCSYMFGEGINDYETLPYCFSRLLGFRDNVLNFGFPGTSTNVAYTVLKSDKFSKLAGHNPKYIIYGFFYDHIFRNFAGSHQNIMFRLKNGQLCELPADSKWRQLFSNSVLRKIYEKEALLLTVKLIEEMNKIAEKKYKASFIVFLYDDEDITNKIRQNLDKLNIRTIKSKIDYLSKPEGYYIIKNECHPTYNANKEIAEQIYDSIFNEKQ